MPFGRARQETVAAPTYAQLEREAQEERDREEQVVAKVPENIDFRTSPRSQIDAHLREVAIASGDVKIFTRKEIKYLPELISKGEKLIRYVSGTLGANTWLIALTSKRIILLNVGMIYGVEHKSIPLDKVNAVSGKEGLLLGKIFVRDGAGEHIIENVQKACVGNFVKAAQMAIEALARQASPTMADAVPLGESRYDKIEKLFRLKEMGALTEAEFQIEKAKLL